VHLDEQGPCVASKQATACHTAALHLLALGHFVAVLRHFEIGTVQHSLA